MTRKKFNTQPFHSVKKLVPPENLYQKNEKKKHDKRNRRLGAFSKT
jgi:hypothetical protein